MTRRMTVAVPSELPGGLDAVRSSHVGRASAFTLIEVAEDGSTGNVRVLSNPADEASPHGIVAAMLVREAVTDLIVEGIGEGMRTRLVPAGVRIWHDARSPTVNDAVRALAAGVLPPLSESEVYPGHHRARSGPSVSLN